MLPKETHKTTLQQLRAYRRRKSIAQAQTDCKGGASACHGYHIDDLIEELEQVYPQIVTKIRFERSTKLSKQEKADMKKIWICPSSRSLGVRFWQGEAL